MTRDWLEEGCRVFKGDFRSKLCEYPRSKICKIYYAISQDFKVPLSPRLSWRKRRSVLQANPEAWRLGICIWHDQAISGPALYQKIIFFEPSAERDKQYLVTRPNPDAAVIL